MTQRTWLMPGPAEVPPSVLEARGTDTAASYGTSWVEFYEAVRVRVSTLLGSTGFTAVLPGNAHLALEVAIRSSAPTRLPVLSIINGHWGNRLAEIAQAVGHDVVRLNLPPWAGIDLDHVESTVRRCAPRVITLAHGESATGVLNPLGELARIAESSEAMLVVDAVATAGVVPIELDRLGRSILATNSSKGLGSETGICVVATSARAWEGILCMRPASSGFFTNLRRWHSRQINHEGASPTIGSISVAQIRVLSKALDLIAAEGVQERFKRHEEVSKDLRKTLAGMGLGVLPDSLALPTITAAELPSGNATSVVRTLAALNIFVDTGIGPSDKDRLLRVGHLGVTATRAHTQRLVEALRGILEQDPNETP